MYIISDFGLQTGACVAGYRLAAGGAVLWIVKILGELTALLTGSHILYVSTPCACCCFCCCCWQLNPCMLTLLPESIIERHPVAITLRVNQHLQHSSS
jgi:hypothetical protein